MLADSLFLWLSFQYLASVVKEQQAYELNVHRYAENGEFWTIYDYIPVFIIDCR